MQILNVTQYPDASSWAASVTIRGFVLSAVLVGGVVRVHQVARKDRRSAPRWAAGHVQRWAEQQVAQLPADWMTAHRAMYAAA